MKTHLSESQIQKEVVAWFRDLEEISDRFSFFAVTNHSAGNARAGKRLKDLGLRAGVHDMVFLLHGGKAIFIELKAMTGYMSKEQKSWDGIVTGLGFSSYCVKGNTGNEVINRILDILESHGFYNNGGRPVTIKTILEKLEPHGVGA